MKYQCRECLRHTQESTECMVLWYRQGVNKYGTGVIHTYICMVIVYLNNSVNCTSM